MRYTLLSLAILILFCCKDKPIPKQKYISYQAKDFSALEAKVDSFFRERYESGNFNGVVLIARSGQIVYEKAMGYADFQTKDTLNIHSSFQLASVSKPLTAMAVLKLVDEGKLHLNDSMQQFFPHFPYHGITIHLLLTHRSGIPNYMYFSESLWKDYSTPIFNENVVELIEKYSPNPYYFPNKRYNYSNTGYCLLASIVEQVSGKPFEQYMKEDIFDPLGMSNTCVRRYDNVDTFNITKGHNRWKMHEDLSYQDGVVGDKGVYSTVEDLYCFDQALEQGLIVSDSLLEKAYTPLHPDLWLSDNYGYGWRINATDSSNKIIYHGGWWKGYKSFFIRIPQKETTIIVLSNTVKGSFVNHKELVNLVL